MSLMIKVEKIATETKLCCCTDRRINNNILQI